VTIQLPFVPAPRAAEIVEREVAIMDASRIERSTPVPSAKKTRMMREGGRRFVWSTSSSVALEPSSSSNSSSLLSALSGGTSSTAAVVNAGATASIVVDFARRVKVQEAESGSAVGSDVASAPQTDVRTSDDKCTENEPISVL